MVILLLFRLYMKAENFNNDYMKVTYCAESSAEDQYEAQTQLIL